MSGKPYLTELEVNYNSYGTHIIFASITSIPLLIFGILHFKIMKPYTAIAYIIYAVCTMILLGIIINESFSHDGISETFYDKVCDDATKTKVV